MCYKQVCREINTTLHIPDDGTSFELTQNPSFQRKFGGTSNDVCMISDLKVNANQFREVPNAR
jgi:hypothetical protein